MALYKEIKRQLGNIGELLTVTSTLHWDEKTEPKRVVEMVRDIFASHYDTSLLDDRSESGGGITLSKNGETVGVISVTVHRETRTVFISCTKM